MYKKQMTVQKLVCLLSIIASVVLFIYTLGLMTDIYDGLKSPMTESRVEEARKALYPEVAKGTDFIGLKIYDEMDAFNKELLTVSIAAILLSVLLYVTNTASRRKYYIANYLAVALNVVFHVWAAIWAHGKVAAFKAQYLALDHAAVEWVYAQKIKAEYVQSTFWFDAHYFVFALTLLASVLLILNVIWKIVVMKEEKRLIAAGKERLA